MGLLAFDTATRATAVAWQAAQDEPALEARDDPGASGRPRHTACLLPLIRAVLERSGSSWAAVERIAVGVGPGTFTGLRIGIATARALAQAADLPLAGVSTLRVLATGAEDEAGPRPVLSVIDAGRGEGFAASFRDDRALDEPAALAPEALAARAQALQDPLAVGSGAVRFRAQLRAAGAAVPADSSPLHRLDGRHLSRLAAAAETADRDAVLPQYLRAPDATPHPR